jgi:hypothetical protein
VPRVDADVPPAAALPAEPTVAAEPDGAIEAPPVAAPLALCPKAYAGSETNVVAKRILNIFIVKLLLLVFDVNCATAVG